MLYKLNLHENKNEYSKVKRVNLADIGWVEKDLEKLLSNNIQDFISSNDLMTIFNERSLQEEPDIVALDRNGELYIFELKRWGSHQENLLQVLRYGQLYGRSDYDDLNEMYKKYQKNYDVDLLDDFIKYFEIEDEHMSKDDFNGKQHFLVVTNGLDQSTVESIIYWKSCGLNIDAIVYWVFEINKEYYIEFNTYSQIDDYLEYENNCYVLNTNMKSDPKYTDEMITEQKAAAYWPGWREKIQKFQKGDTVFLYKSGTGIIAYGKADGKLVKCENEGYADYEYNMHLDDFHILSNPISAAKMKEITECGYNFRQTLFAISEDASKKLIKHAKSNK